MDFIAIIPARLNSTRLPFKPLADIHGKPMIVRVIERVKCSQASRVIVSTDHNSIVKLVKNIGEEVCLTSSKHKSGIERIKETIDIYGFSDNQIIVNVQGDEPLISPKTINKSVESILIKKTNVSTIATPILGIQELIDSDIVKVVVNIKGYALYFSRSAIPFNRGVFNKFNKNYNYFLRHIGVYAYKAKFIRSYVNWTVSPLEKMESLEQLRILWHNRKIHVSVIDEKTVSINVNTPKQLIQVRKLYKKLLKQKIV